MFKWVFDNQMIVTSLTYKGKKHALRLAIDNQLRRIRIIRCFQFSKVAFE